MGWPSNFGARFLSYCRDGIGNISGSDKLVSYVDPNTSELLLLLSVAEMFLKIFNTY